MTLKFNAKAHRYWLDSKPIPGVTTLLGKGLPKPALPYWSAKCVAEFVVDEPEQVDQLRSLGRGPAVAALKAIPWQARDEAAVRGTAVHAHAEDLVHGREIDVPDHLVAHVEGYARWLDDFQVEALYTEHPVANRKWFYAGTFDAVVKFGRGPWAGRTVLADWKTSKAVYGETALQTAAYARADFLAPDPDTEVPMPAVDATGVLHITDAGSQFHPLSATPEDIDEAFKVFSHIAYVANKTDWIKGLVGEPMRLEDAEAAA